MTIFLKATLFWYSLAKLAKPGWLGFGVFLDGNIGVYGITKSRQHPPSKLSLIYLHEINTPKLGCIQCLVLIGQQFTNICIAI